MERWNEIDLKATFVIFACNKSSINYVIDFSKVLVCTFLSQHAANFYIQRKLINFHKSNSQP